MNIFIIGGPTVSDYDPAFGEQAALLKATMGSLGQDIINRGHTLLVCSPFDGSADLEAVKGAALAQVERCLPYVHYYIPDNSTIRAKIEALRLMYPKLRIQEFLSHGPGTLDIPETKNHAWLLAQLCALDRSHAIVAVGGKAMGPMSLLLALAESRRKPILPLRYLQGAAGDCFERQRHFIQDRLGGQMHVLGEPTKVKDLVDSLELLASDELMPGPGRSGRKFFLSYAKARPGEADFVETTLRRRNCIVFRDELDFTAGNQLLQEIHQFIYQADIFIALWCSEYAGSPWCFDELDTALNLQAEGRLKVWLLCLDETRIVPPKARLLINYPARCRKALEGTLLTLLDRKDSA